MTIVDAEVVWKFSGQRLIIKVLHTHAVVRIFWRL